MKKQLGQYYTTNADIILQGLTIPTSVPLIEPFAGNGDLIKNHTAECYDIAPRFTGCTKQDTLLHPPDFSNKFVITNPPYIARNKNTTKTLYEQYNTNDLYKCFIRILITNQPVGGILIIPLNFWTSCRKNDVLLRKDFLEHYSVSRINVFEEPVFTDTTTTVCSFAFDTKHYEQTTIHFFPSKRIVQATFTEPLYIVGSSFYSLKGNGQYTIARLITNQQKTSSLHVKCIDDIHCFYDETIDYCDKTPNKTNRTYITLSIEPLISPEKQKELARVFNETLTEYRERYNSLFLTNYREFNRKRITFELVYSLIDYCLINL